MTRPFVAAAFASLLAAVACGHDAPSPSATRASHDAVLPRAPETAFHPAQAGHEASGDGYRARVTPSDGAIEIAVRPRHARASASLGLRTVAIERGRALWTTDDAALLTLQAGRISIARGTATEHLVATRTGVEQSWSFPAPPAGDGPLRVRVHASGGLRLSERTGHIRADAGIAAVSYRDAAWVDARGARTALSMKLAEDEVILEVPEEVVLSSAYPATLDPTIGPELTLDAPTVAVHRYGAYWPRIGAGKDGTALVVWEDYRVSAPFGNSLFSGTQLMGARLSAAGQVLDPTGIVVASERDFFYGDYAIAYDGAKSWFVAWSQNGMNAAYHQLWGTIVDDTGNVVSSRPTTGADSSSRIATAFDGTNFLVVFTPGLYATRFSLSGQPVDALPKLVGATTQYSLQPGLACRAAGSCLVAWATAAGARAARIGANLAIVDVTPIALTSTSGDIAGVVYDGQSWVVAVGPQLVRVDPATGVVIGTTTTGPDGISSVAADATGTWATWSRPDNQIAGTRMARDGTLAATGPFTWTTGATGNDPAVAVGGGTLHLTYSEAGQSALYEDVYAARVSLVTGAPLDGDGIPINRAANGQTWPSVASSNTNHLVAWVDSRAVRPLAAYAARIAADGTLLDTTATLLDPLAYRTAAASDGTDYLVVWEASTGRFDTTAKIRAVRVSGATGAVLGTSVELGSGYRPSVAFDGTQYVVAWIGTGTYAQRISTAGALVGGPIQLSTKPTSLDDGDQTDVASNGTVTLVVSTSGPTGVQGVRLDKAGQVLDSPPIAVGDGPGRQYFPKVAWDGAQFLAVWEDYRAGMIIEPDVYGARVTAAGAVLPPGDIRIGTGPAAQVFPAVIGMGDGHSALVVWSDDRNPARYKDFAMTGTWMRRSDGKLLDRDPVTLSDRAGNEIGAALAPAGPGRALLAYHVMDSSPGQGNTRVRVRFIGSGTATGQTCTKDEDCVTRACTDGVCCDRTCRGTCETCSATPGTCTGVVNAEDPDTCGGESVCGAQSECKRKQGRGCTVDADCVSGVCAQGVCCDRRCDSPCETCPPASGVCALRPARSAGAPTCSPYACDGESATCPGSCTSNAACPSGSRCDTTAGVCVSGTTCLDARTALLPDQSTVECAPYTCAGGTCRTSCRSVADCVSPALCDEVGQCVLSPGSSALGGGCSAARSGGPVGDPNRAWLVLFGAALLFAGARRPAIGVSSTRGRARRRG